MEKTIEKLSSEEFDHLALHGRGRSSPAFNAIVSLQPGEAITIKKTGWKPKYPPTRLVKKIEKKYGFRFKRGALPDRSGWAVQRIK
ncbi:MAG: hypothetical protein ACHQNT_04700 [Bacteroidia bacterium]